MPAIQEKNSTKEQITKKVNERLKKNGHNATMEQYSKQTENPIKRGNWY